MRAYEVKIEQESYLPNRSFTALATVSTSNGETAEGEGVADTPVKAAEIAILDASCELLERRRT